MITRVPKSSWSCECAPVSTESFMLSIEKMENFGKAASASRNCRWMAALNHLMRGGFHCEFPPSPSEPILLCNEILILLWNDIVGKLKIPTILRWCKLSVNLLENCLWTLLRNMGTAVCLEWRTSDRIEDCWQLLTLNSQSWPPSERNTVHNSDCKLCSSRNGLM